MLNQNIFCLTKQLIYQNFDACGPISIFIKNKQNEQQFNLILQITFKFNQLNSSLKWFFLLQCYYSELRMTEQKEEVIGIMSTSQKIYICFNANGIFQFKDERSNMKKIYTLIKKISLKIVQTEILNNNNYRFLIRVTEDNHIIDVYIESKEELQLLFKLMGNSTTISDLHEIVTSFKKIGEGSFAQVYLGITNFQTKFAAKCFLKKVLYDDPKLKKSFHNQIEIMKHLKSKYITPFDYIFETQKAFYLKMEYFENSLPKLFSKKMLINTQKKIMKQLLFALVQMKNKGIIHRDLKPENIMIRKTINGESECVLIDFGLATFQDTHSYLYVRCGTPGFIAPQIANLTNKKGRQTCAADMFSLGCIFFIMYQFIQKRLTGHHLFSARAAADVLAKNKKCDYSRTTLDKFSVKCIDLSYSEKDLFLKMIEMNPLIRITPQAALKHSYFEEDIDDCDDIPEEQCIITKHLKRISRLSRTLLKRVSLSTESALEQSRGSIASQVNYILKKSINDSCVTFELGPNKSAADEVQSVGKQKKTGYECLQIPLNRHSRFSKNSDFDVQII